MSHGGQCLAAFFVKVSGLFWPVLRIARIFDEMGADAATMEKARSIRSAADAEKEKYRKMTGRSI